MTDVALTTSNHHGSQLATFHALHRDWIEAIGDVQDELFDGMLDAGDCFRAASPAAPALLHRHPATNRLQIPIVGTLRPGPRSPPAVSFFGDFRTPADRA